MTIAESTANAGKKAASDVDTALRIVDREESRCSSLANPALGCSLPPLLIIDVIKALASQLIIWHHFISYGPMAKTLHPHATRLFDWLYNDGRLAVQAFLVLGGFLAARSLAPQPNQLSFDLSESAIARLAWRRYLRLVRPYLVALVLAVVLSAFARFLMSDPDTPAAPSLKQVLFHALLIHDIAGVDALTTGAWYVAMDFQLYCMLLALLWAAQRLASILKVDAQTTGLCFLVGLATLSLLWFNRNDSMETWGIFFFGSYGLGVMMQWASSGKSKKSWTAFLLVIFLLALALEWRKPLIASMLTAAFLGLGLRARYQPGHRLNGFVGWLSRISYSAFLIHYPIVLIVGTIVARLWPGHVPMAAIGFVAAWLMTWCFATVLYNRVEVARARIRTDSSNG